MQPIFLSVNSPEKLKAISIKFKPIWNIKIKKDGKYMWLPLPTAQGYKGQALRVLNKTFFNTFFFDLVIQ